MSAAAQGVGLMMIVVAEASWSHILAMYPACGNGVPTNLTS